MNRWARFVCRRGPAALFVILWLALAGALAPYAANVAHDDDLLAFLPQGNEDVAHFRKVAKTFLGLEVAVVGFEASDVFERDFFAQLRTVTRALNARAEVKYALSAANVQDFRKSPSGGIDTDLLVPAKVDPAAVRDRVLGERLVAGELVAHDGQAMLLICFSEHDVDPREFANAVRQEATLVFGAEPLFFAGAPFISSYIFDTTQADLSRLTPWAVLAVVLLILISFRNVRGAALVLVSTVLAIIISVGLMGVMGFRYNIVLSSLPVILFSVGSAYATHLLASILERGGSVERALIVVGPRVIAAGLTTIVGLGSFVMMDIGPIRVFGGFAALGILLCLMLALSFVPAAAHLLRLAGQGHRSADHEGLAVAWARVLVAHRSLAALSLFVLVALAAKYTTHIDSHMDQRAFFSDDSEPARAEAFLALHFGGSDYAQVEVRGPVTEPDFSIALDRFADAALTLPAVISVRHMGEVLARLNQAMEDQRRVPDRRDQIELLLRLSQGEESIRQLVDDARTSALVQIKLASVPAAARAQTLRQLEALVQEHLNGTFQALPSVDKRARDAFAAYAIGKLAGPLVRKGVPLSETQRAAAAIAAISDHAPSGIPVKIEVERFLGSEESLVAIPEGRTATVAASLAALGPGFEDAGLDRALAATLPDMPEIDREDLKLGLLTALSESWRRARARRRASGVMAVLTDAQRDACLGCADRLSEILPLADRPSMWVPSSVGSQTVKVESRVTGLPVLHRALSRSAVRNQWASMVSALLMVLVTLSIFFRSLRWGLLATFPTALTLLVIHGAMGLLGIRLDIGTSMLASIIVGAGVDYSVHLVAALRADATGGARAVTETGHAVWTNAAMVAVGFVVLTLGEARTLDNIGWLTACAMMLAAACAFTVIPVAASRMFLPVPAKGVSS